MTKIIIDLWSYLGEKHRLQLFIVAVLMLSSVFFEAVSLGAILPFLGALTDPESLMKLEWFQPVNIFFQFKSANEILLPITIIFIIITIISSGLRILLLWMNVRLTADMAIMLRKDVYARTLYQPYEQHITRNSSKLITLITEKISVTITAGIMHVLYFITALIMSVAIIFTLLLMNTFLAISAFIILGGGYFLMGYITRKRIRRNGEYIASNQPKAVQCVQEGLGNIRDIIIESNQNTYIKIYYDLTSKIQIAALNNAFLSMLPKYLLEMIGLIFIAVFAYYLQAQPSQESSSVLPMLGVLALGAQRLLPALQQIYMSWSTINGATPILTEVVSYLHSPLPSDLDIEKNIKPLLFQNNMILKDLNFKYSGASEYVFENINLNIIAGSRIGFIGSTGSGKSTLLDIIMGLLPPTSGELIVDGTVLNIDNIQQWQANISHVPQAIFLSDATMAENIALGVNREQIDQHRVEDAARQAHLHHFIESLPNGYKTTVGERGVQISGGQRQRIGIARALYNQGNVIIFDEATSALDNATEEIVMQTIDSLGKNYTILMIAHRLSTLKECDIIYKLEKGAIVASGSYSDMVGR